jgi:hypothetical protein
MPTKGKGNKPTTRERKPGFVGPQRNPLSMMAKPSRVATLGTLGFPRSLHIKHRYAETFNLVSTTGALATYQFSCNGMYDPNITGTGHQPQFFDAVGGVYNHYCVLRSRIEYEFYPGVNAFLGAYTDDDTSVASSIAAVCEQSDSTHVLALSGAGQSIKLTKSWEAKDWFGGDIRDNDDLAGTIAANPAEQVYFNLALVACDGTSTVTAFVKVNITYEAVWDEIKTQGTN